MKKRGFKAGDPRAKLAGRKGGTVHGHQRRLLERREWQLRYPEVPPEMAAGIWKDGYDTGYHAGRRNTERIRW